MSTSLTDLNKKNQTELVSYLACVTRYFPNQRKVILAGRERRIYRVISAFAGGSPAAVVLRRRGGVPASVFPFQSDVHSTGSKLAFVTPLRSRVNFHVFGHVFRATWLPVGQASVSPFQLDAPHSKGGNSSRPAFLCVRLLSVLGKIWHKNSNVVQVSRTTNRNVWPSVF